MPLSMGFTRQVYWSGLPFSFFRGIFPTRGLNLCLLCSAGIFLTAEPLKKPLVLLPSAFILCQSVVDMQLLCPDILLALKAGTTELRDHKTHRQCALQDPLSSSTAQGFRLWVWLTTDASITRRAVKPILELTQRIYPSFTSVFLFFLKPCHPLRKQTAYSTK